MVVLQYPVASICSPLISSSIGFVLDCYDGGRRQRGRSTRKVWVLYYEWIAEGESEEGGGKEEVGQRWGGNGEGEG